MQFGVHLPLISFGDEQRSLADLFAFTEAAASLGYDALCVNDHLAFGRPWLDGLAALAAVIAPSGSMQLMTTVVVPALRGPAATAKSLAAIDVLSGGRLIVGVGPGSSARDYELAAVPFEERWSRLDEAVGTLRALWSGASYEGSFYRTGDTVLRPHPAQATLPIWIGSWGSAPGMRRVARLGDGWLASGYNTTPAAFAAAWQRLQSQLAQARERESRSIPNGIATMWSHVTDDPSEAEHVLSQILAPMLNRPVEELRDRLPIGTAEECAEKLRSYAEAGAQRVFLWPVRDEVRQLEIFRDRVWPHVQ